MFETSPYTFLTVTDFRSRSFSLRGFIGITLPSRLYLFPQNRYPHFNRLHCEYRKVGRKREKSTTPKRLSAVGETERTWKREAPLQLFFPLSVQERPLKRDQGLSRLLRQLNRAFGKTAANETEDRHLLMTGVRYNPRRSCIITRDTIIRVEPRKQYLDIASGFLFLYK